MTAEIKRPDTVDGGIIRLSMARIGATALIVITMPGTMVRRGRPDPPPSDTVGDVMVKGCSVDSAIMTCRSGMCPGRPMTGHGATAARAAAEIVTGQPVVTVAVIRRGGILDRRRRRHGQQAATGFQFGGAAAIGEKAVMADAVEAVGYGRRCRCRPTQHGDDQPRTPRTHRRAAIATAGPWRMWRRSWPVRPEWEL